MFLFEIVNKMSLFVRLNVRLKDNHTEFVKSNILICATRQSKPRTKKNGIFILLGASNQVYLGLEMVAFHAILICIIIPERGSH